jgi:hypothetical protein
VNSNNPNWWLTTTHNQLFCRQTFVVFTDNVKWEFLDLADVKRNCENGAENAMVPELGE